MGRTVPRPSIGDPMNRFRSLPVLVALAFASVGGACLTQSSLAHAEDGPSANDIAARIIRGNGLTLDGAHTKLRMILKDAKGEVSERALDVIGRKTKDGLESVVRFK